MRITLNKIVKFTLILLLALNGVGKLHAGNFLSEVQDTTLTKGKYIIVIHALPDDAESILVDSLYASFIETPKLSDEIMMGHDSIVNLLASQIQMGMIKFRWSDDSYMESVTCRNGVKLIFRDGIRFQKYYPKEDIVVMEWCDWIFNLATGEKDYDPEFTFYSQSRALRIVSAIHVDRSPYEEMQVYSRKQKRYLPLFNLSELIDKDIDYRFWSGEEFCFYVNDKWWKITLSSK